MAASAPKTRAEPAGLVRIPRHIDAKLTELSEKTGRPKSWYARKALETYLEDMHDRLIAEQALAEPGPRVSLDDVLRRYGLDDRSDTESRKADRPARSGRSGSGVAVRKEPASPRRRSISAG